MKACIRSIALLCALLFPGLAMAQNTITCASAPGGGRTYCAADTRGGVVLVTPRGPRVPCQQGVQWGFDARGIWVQGGCAADFRVQPYKGGPWWWDSGPGNRPAPWQGTGACFFRKVGYDGPYFCMSRGQRDRPLAGQFQQRHLLDSDPSRALGDRLRAKLLSGVFGARSGQHPEFEAMADSGYRQELEQQDFVDPRGLSSATGAVGRILF